MSMGIRSFVEFLIREIKKEGLLGAGYSDDERIHDLEGIIWDAYDRYEG